MTKLYYPSPDELQGTKPQHSKLWYSNNQSVLVALLNTQEGRDFFCWKQTPYPIVAVGPNRLVEDLSKDAGPGVWRTTFRTAPKYSNRIRSDWFYFRNMFNRISLEEIMAWPLLGGGPRLAAAARFATTTFHPNPHDESTSVDGRVRYLDVAGQDWGIIRGQATGTAAAPSDATVGIVIRADGNANKWDLFDRVITLFDTSSIADDNVSSATYSMKRVSLSADNFTDSLSMVATTPANNDDLVTGDFDAFVGDPGTKQASDITVASTSDGVYADWAVNPTGLTNIITTGISKFGCRSTADNDDQEPSENPGEATDIAFSMADTSGTSSDPKLAVVHAANLLQGALII